MGHIDTSGEESPRDELPPAQADALKVELASGDERRAQLRHSVLIGIKLRRPGETWFTSRISDLTENGFRLHSFVHLAPGMTVWVMFSGFEGRRASVIWADAHEAGCVFEKPLHKAIYEHIMRNNH